MKEPTLLWLFNDAPEDYKKLSGHGGDEDFVIVVPAGVEIDSYMLAEKLTVCSYETHRQLDGSVIYITCHA